MFFQFFMWHWWCPSEAHTLRTAAQRKKKKNQNLFTQTSRIQLMAYLFTVSFSHPKWHSSTSKFWTIRTLDLMVNATSLTHQPWVELPVIKHLSQSLRSVKFSSSANFLVSPFPTTVETCFLLWELQHYSSRPFLAKIKLLSADQSWVLPTMYNVKRSAASVLLPAFSTPSWALLISSLGWCHGEPSACRLLPEKVLWLHAASACCTTSTWPGPPAQHSFHFIPHWFPGLFSVTFQDLFSFLKTSILSDLSTLIWSIYLSFILLSSLKERYILSQKFSDVSSRCPLAVFLK